MRKYIFRMLTFLTLLPLGINGYSETYNIDSGSSSDIYYNGGSVVTTTATIAGTTTQAPYQTIVKVTLPNCVISDVSWVNGQTKKVAIEVGNISQVVSFVTGVI